MTKLSFLTQWSVDPLSSSIPMTLARQAGISPLFTHEHPDFILKDK